MPFKYEREINQFRIKNTQVKMESKKIRSLDLISEDRTCSGFSYFMDGSRRTYKIGDMVLEGKKIYPVVAASTTLRKFR